MIIIYNRHLVTIYHVAGAEFSHQLPFFTGPMLSAVTANAHTAYANTETSLSGRTRGSVPMSLWSQHFHQPINTHPCFRCVSRYLL